MCLLPNNQTIPLLSRFLAIVKCWKCDISPRASKKNSIQIKNRKMTIKEKGRRRKWQVTLPECCIIDCKMTRNRQYRPKLCQPF